MTGPYVILLMVGTCLIAKRHGYRLHLPHHALGGVANLVGLVATAIQAAETDIEIGAQIVIGLLFCSWIVDKYAIAVDIAVFIVSAGFFGIEREWALFIPYLAAGVIASAALYMKHEHHKME